MLQWVSTWALLLVPPWVMWWVRQSAKQLAQPSEQTSEMPWGPHSAKLLATHWVQLLVLP